MKNEPKTIDFTKGTWGHKIHGETFSKVKAASILDRFKDWKDGAERHSFLCHSSKVINVGDHIAWQAGGGYAVLAPVYQVERKRDPSDMYLVHIRMTEDCRSDEGAA